MKSIEQFYVNMGTTAKEVVNRLGGDAETVKLFLSKFKDDKTFEGFKKALDEGDTPVAFRAVHTLKGVCANLGLENLYKKAYDVTEMLRAGNLEEAREAYPSLEELYNNAIEEINELV